jgi:hypothetical protein
LPVLSRWLRSLAPYSLALSSRISLPAFAVRLQEQRIESLLDALTSFFSTRNPVDEPTADSEAAALGTLEPGAPEGTEAASFEVPANGIPEEGADAALGVPVASEWMRNEKHPRVRD